MKNRPESPGGNVTDEQMLLVNHLSRLADADLERLLQICNQLAAQRPGSAIARAMARFAAWMLAGGDLLPPDGLTAAEMREAAVVLAGATVDIAGHPEAKGRAEALRIYAGILAGWAAARAAVN